MPASRCHSAFDQIFDDVMADSLKISGNPRIRLHILATDNEAFITIATQLLEIAGWRWVRWQNNVVFHYVRYWSNMHTPRIDTIFDRLFDAYCNSGGTRYHTLVFSPVMGYTETKCVLLLLHTAGWYVYSTAYDRDMCCSTIRIMGVWWPKLSDMNKQCLKH